MMAFSQVTVATRKVAMNLQRDASHLLDQLRVLRRPSDLDLLIFFARHPRTLLASEQLAGFLGYEVKDIAASLELLLDAGLLTRTPSPRHAARLYTLAVTSLDGGLLPDLRRATGTREGRLALLQEMRRRSSEVLSPRGIRSDFVDVSPPEPLPFPGGRSALEESRRRPSASADTPELRQRGGVER
jgi:hypothetical protein